MNNNKGQAALEFLTTYGWAFLVILVMIGALAYFGVLDPTRFLPQRCQFGAEMHCERFSLNSNGPNATFELANALPEDVYIDGIQYKLPSNETWSNCTDASGTNIGSGLGTEISRESLGTLSCTMSAGTINPGDKERVQFKLIYSQAGGSFDSRYANDLFGEIYANVR